jgi:Flp pilus assembly pilin Flp
MRQITLLIRNLRDVHCEEGQTLAEYSLVVALIAIGLVGTLTMFAVSMDGLYEDIKHIADVLMGA